MAWQPNSGVSLAGRWVERQVSPGACSGVGPWRTEAALLFAVSSAVPQEWGFLVTALPGSLEVSELKAVPLPTPACWSVFSLLKTEGIRRRRGRKDNGERRWSSSGWSILRSNRWRSQEPEGTFPLLLWMAVCSSGAINGVWPVYTQKLWTESDPLGSTSSS